MLKKIALATITSHKRWVTAALLASLPVLLPGSTWADVKLAEHWRLLGSGSSEPVKPGTPYGLQNLVNMDALILGHQDCGIDLQNVKIKEKGRPRNVTFQRQSGATDPLKYGERVALYIKKEKDTKADAIFHKVRDCGPNLGRSKEQPKYEWEIRGGNAGETVKTDIPLGLYSTVQNDHLVYCERPLSVNLRWLKDKESEGCYLTWQKAIELGGRAIGTYYGGAAGGEAGAKAGKVGSGR